jgi:hypothetical protein
LRSLILISGQDDFIDMVKNQVLTLISCSLAFGAALTALPHAVVASTPASGTLLAQSSATGCRDWESTFVATETANYRVYICGGDNPQTYVGVSKRNPRNSIRLPLTDYDAQGNFYAAVNGNVTYMLAKTPRGMFLTVTQGTRELLREPTLQPW